MLNSLNSIDREIQTLNESTLKLAMNFEDFRSDTRAYWEHLSDTRSSCAQQQAQLHDHEVRHTRLEAS